MAPNLPTPPRTALRRRLLDQRRAWASTAQASQAQADLQARVLSALAQLEPGCLGVYWPMQREFNPMAAAAEASRTWGCALALPYATREPASLHFRAWNGAQPDTEDECRIPTSSGLPVVPDVVLVPCVGFTAEGWRLGYGGGYFDRFLQAHPEVTAIGVAWEHARLTAAELAPEAHDIPLMAVLTESNSWGG